MRLFLPVLAVLVALALSACNTTEPEHDPPPRQLTMTVTNMTLRVGDSVSVIFSDTSVAYVSTDSSVATFVPTGIVQGIIVAKKSSTVCIWGLREHPIGPSGTNVCGSSNPNISQSVVITVRP